MNNQNGMTGFDVLAGLALCGYIAIVAVKGNGGELLALAKRDWLPFGKWAGALLLLYWLKGRVPGDAQGIVDGFITLGILGFFLLHIRTISTNAKAVVSGGLFYESGVL